MGLGWGVGFGHGSELGWRMRKQFGGWLVLVGLVWLGLGYGFRLGGDRVWVLVSVRGLGLIRCGS